MSEAEITAGATATAAKSRAERARVASARLRIERAFEVVIEALIRICGVSAIFFVLAIFVFVFKEGYEFLVNRLDGWQFLTSIEWYPDSNANKRYGALALIAGTASITGIAMVIAIPFGLGAAIYVSEFSSGRTKEALKIVIELLAAVPSVVWGFIGLAILNPLIIDLFGAPVGLNALNAGLLVAMMSMPLIVSIGEDALKAVPDSYREAAVAMGATRWQMIRRVLVPAGKNGLLAAVLLGVGRSIGETMAVLMASGHSVNVPHSPLDSVRTLTATIAAELGETARGGDHYQVLFVIGMLLFVITFTVNLTADLIVRGVKRT